MFRNYFKTTWRSLAKNKLSTMVNIGGLAVGMAVAMLIGLWVWDELSYDKFHDQYDRIAKLRQHINVNGHLQTEKTVPYPLAAELQSNYGNYFKYIVMSSHRGPHIISFADKNTTQTGVYLEPAATEMLGLKMVKGTRAGLKEPSSILLSQSVAHTYFGNEDPLNKTMKIDNKLDVKVTGVYQDLLFNSTFASVRFIAPFQLYLNNSWVKDVQDKWENSPVQAYVQIADNADMDKVSVLIKDIKLNKINTEQAKFKPAIFLDPMSKWHLYSDFRNGVREGGKIQYVWMFAIIGVFVLLLACINFMNLSTARAEKRAKEVGIRKTLGSPRAKLIAQFFCESLLVTTIAFFCAVCLVQIFLPFFNQLADKSMRVQWANPLFWLFGIGFSLITGVIAGSYPALYLSSFQPLKVLKGSLRVGWLAAVPRKVLVVLQFTVSIALIISTIVVYRQLQFTKSRPVGYDRRNLIIVPLATNDIPLHFETVKEELIKTGVVKAVASSESTTTDIWATDNNLEWKGKDPNIKVDFPNTGVSFDYGKTVGWQFVQGRDFSKNFPSDSTGFVLNEAAVKFMGLKNPIAETILWDNHPFHITGVIKDVITESPYEPVRPSIYCMARQNSNYLFIRTNAAVNINVAISKIESIFKKYSPSAPFDYKFVNDEFNKKFGNEERIGRLTTFFAVLAVLISCLGLFGLASFVAEQRTKEIGIRKVVGASVFSLWKMLSKEFVVLVFISCFIAIPLAYYFLQEWLQNYQYRTEISWWIFVAAMSCALAITLLTVSFQAIKAAIANPVKSLRTE